MKTRFLPLIALASGLWASTATAQTTPPVLILNITDIQVTDDTVGNTVTIVSGGSAYAGVAPVVTFSGGGPPAGSAGVAKGTAILSNGGAGNTVVSVNVTNPGFGYIGPPTVTFSGGGASGVGATIPTQATAIAFLNISQDFPLPNQNEAYGPAGDTIGMLALASGTQPQTGFIYSFTVNGLSIGRTAVAANPGDAEGIYWTPPLPGIYSIVASTSDGNGNTATSAPIRYFAEGTVIVSPEAGGVPTPLPPPTATPSPGSLVTVGSTVVIQATSTSADGFISRIDFYTDWTGSIATSTFIGTSRNYPYSVIYQPAGGNGVRHLIKAIGYDNNNVLVPPAVVQTFPNQDEILLTMATASPNGGLPTATLVTPLSGTLVEIPSYAADPSADIPVIVSAAGKGGAQITKVELYINGVLFATDNLSNSGQYDFKWTPQSTGAFALLALAYDSNGNVVPSMSLSQGSTVPVAGASTIIIEAAPAIAITSPGSGATIGTGGASIKAVAIDTNLDLTGNTIPIVRVDFYQDGNFVKAATSPVSGDEYGISFTPVQKVVNGVPVPSVLTAIATDAQGFQGTSPAISVNVTAGGGSGGTIGTPPTAVLVSPVNNANVIVNSPVVLTASGTAPNGNIAKVEFLVDSVVVGTLTQYPYAFTYKFQNLGTYYVQAQVTDNVGDVAITQSPGTKITVVTEPPPTVKISTPTTGGTVTTGSSVSVTVNASSLSGTISQVEFFANGISIGVVTQPPYTVSFTPLSAGLFTFTAVATDGAGETTTSAPVIVEAFPASGGLGTTSYFGQYQGLTDGGRFAFMVIDGKYGTFIGHSNAGTAVSTTFASDIAVSPGGTFAAKAMTGNVSSTGVSGNLIPSQDLFIGAATQSGSAAVASGFYSGNIQGVPGSQFTAIVGADGSIMAYVASGSYTDVADGAVDSTGAFTITTSDNNTFTGKVDPATGFLNGTLSGASGGVVLAARVSGGTFSDGVLKNISTRGQVGSGANAMIAGFVVGGSASKQLLVRAIGPTLSTFGLAGSIASTKLQVFSGATMISSNTGWSSTPGNALAVSNADAQVGAFALPSGSADSALVGSFPPGNYTAMVSGAGSNTGLGLVEIYDMDLFNPFSTMKLTNVSTRGEVGSGNNVLIGGFVINGTAPKRLLIRGAGPSLSALNVSGALATPHLILFDSAQTQIRENYSWQTGNDAGLVAAAASATGAFAFGNGSADSAILIVLPPGSYTAEVAGANGATGTALVEVYEVP